MGLLDPAALVRTLAEQGREGVRALLTTAEHDDAAVARRIAALRERLRRQASRQVGRLLEQYERRAAELDLVQTRQRELLEEEIRRLEARLKAARALDLSSLTDPDLLADVRAALLVPDASWMHPERPRGFLAWLRGILARLVAFFRRLFGRRKARRPQREEGRTIPIATLAAEGRLLGPSAVGSAIAQLTPPQQDELRDRVEQSIHGRERDLQREAETKRREAEAQRRRLAEEQEEARRRAERDVDRRVREAEERRVTRELKERGLLSERGGQLAVTYGLVERFARLILEEESRSLPGDVQLSLKGSASTGIYEKARLRQPDEVAHLDIPSSLLAARVQGLRHIDESTSYVYREITSERVHVVLMFDKSGSMAESEKLTAAKKALLALYIAIRRRYPDATIDVVAFENEVRILDLVELWECQPGSFTNTGEALHTAHLLLRASRASRREVFLVTDGLPEAFTDPEGRVRSGNLDVAMEYALARATELATVTSLRFAMILLRSEHPEYERAARLLTRALGGELVLTDPRHLGFELLVRWAGGTETVRKSRPTSGEAAVPVARAPGTARIRRRKADRRMGG